MVMTVDQLMDVLQDLSSSTASVSAARAEIRQRTEYLLTATATDAATAATAATTAAAATAAATATATAAAPDAILMRTVNGLHLVGRCDLAHACLVVFAGAVPDPALLQHCHDSDTSWLVAWLVDSARARAATLGVRL